MKVGFAGTPPFAATVLAALLDAGFAVPFVLTQPDRPRGRGLQHEPSAVKRLALARGVAVRQPTTLKGGGAREMLAATQIDVLAVAAYGLLLPPAILATPVHGCINVHASLLPRWRGAAPIQRAILAGDRETGVSIMQMDAGLDTGPVLDAARVPIGARETAGTLEGRLASAGAQALVATLQRLARAESVPRTPQPETGVTYARKVDKAEAAIDWSAPATTIDRQVRAFDPAPGAFTSLAGETVKVWRAETEPFAPAAAPGTVVATDAVGVLVACGKDAVRLVEVQPAGGRRMSGAAFSAGRRIAPGAHFGVESR